MSTRERPAEKGRRRGQQLVVRLLAELRNARLAADLSEGTVARALGWSQSAYCRFETGAARTNLPDLASAAAVLGLELSAGLHLVGDPLRDSGHSAVIARFRAILSTEIRVVSEALLPTGDYRRAWDLLLRIEHQLVGVEAETRIRDEQALVRHIRMRERDGGADEIILLLADGRANRALVPGLLEALGPRFRTSPRQILAALRAGKPVPGSGVILL